jgi:hypothetical protein
MAGVDSERESSGVREVSEDGEPILIDGSDWSAGASSDSGGDSDPRADSVGWMRMSVLKRLYSLLAMDARGSLPPAAVSECARPKAEQDETTHDAMRAARLPAAYEVSCRVRGDKLPYQLGWIHPRVWFPRSTAISGEFGGDVRY